MRTLRQALRTFFAGRGRPATGEQFVHGYGALHTSLRAKLDAPFDGDVDFQSIANMLATMPLGRAITLAELRAASEHGDDDAEPALTENAISWISQSGETTASLVAALVARTVLQCTDDGQDAGSAGARLQRALGAPEVVWNVDYAGLVRVSRLLAAMRRQREITARTLADAALLVICRTAWEAVHSALVHDATRWALLSSAYRTLREQVAAVDRYGHARLLSIALFARDGLLPLPSSGVIADVRLPGHALGFAWPGAHGGIAPDPLVSSPLALDDSALLTHLLLPGLRERGVTVPWREPAVRGAPLIDAVGRTPDRGGWKHVLARVIERYGFAADIEGCGYNVEELLDFACGAPANAPAARRVAPPAGSATVPSTGARISPAASGPTHEEIVASMREQGVIGHAAALSELALLCDGRLTEMRAPRILIAGPPGCGKKRLLTALANATYRPFVLVNASAIAENGWAGVQISDVVALAWRAAGGDLARAERAFIYLNDVDDLRVPRALPRVVCGDDDPFSNEARAAAMNVGRQKALLALLDPAGVVTFTPQHGQPPLQLRTANLIIVAAGGFSGLEVAGRQPTDDELEAFGFTTEFIARLEARVVLRSPTVAELEQLFLHGADAVAPAVRRCREFGFELVVAPEAVRLVAAAAARGHAGLNARAGAALLTSTVHRALLEVLHGERRGGGVLVIGPDELLRELPSLRSARAPDDH